MSRTQRQIVLDLLAERGDRGVSAREAIYDLHITRLAAIIFDLRQDGFKITSETKRGETARYFLHPNQRDMPRLCATCGHPYRQHIAAMKCVAMLNPEAGLAAADYCQCQQFVEVSRG